jgi:hypothetical protein
MSKSLKHPFAIGSVITGTQESSLEYDITTDKATLIVISYDKDGRGNHMSAEIVNHKNPRNRMYIGKRFWVDPSFFKLLKDQEQDEDNQI